MIQTFWTSFVVMVCLQWLDLQFTGSQLEFRWLIILYRHFVKPYLQRFDQNMDGFFVQCCYLILLEIDLLLGNDALILLSISWAVDIRLTAMIKVSYSYFFRWVNVIVLSHFSINSHIFLLILCSWIDFLAFCSFAIFELCYYFEANWGVCQK